MALSAFPHGPRAPNDTDIRATLGPAFATWTRLLTAVGQRLGPVSMVWASAGPSTGWGLRVKLKERTMLYMTPQERQLLVSFALGERAVAAAAAARLPAAINEAIAFAPRYAEGRGVRIQVRTSRLIPGIAKLAEIRRSH